MAASGGTAGGKGGKGRGTASSRRSRYAAARKNGVRRLKMKGRGRDAFSYLPF